MEKLKVSFAGSGNAKWYKHLEKQYAEIKN